MPSTENGKYTNSNATPMVDIDRNKSHRFKAIIVGGSVTGLVLALSLQHVGIDFVVLEARDRIDPQAGASIGISSNGARILDQLGVYEDIERRTEPPIWHELVTGRGKLLQKSDSLQLIQARMGYAITFLERRLALKLLLDHIQNKNQILTNKKAIYVDHHTDGVIVHCNDGSQFSGDIVVAADGAHSSIRREMWLHVDRCIGPLKMAEDERAMSAEYRCLFGISSLVPGLERHTHYRALNKDWSFLVVVGNAGRCFWFVFERLQQKYHVPNIPRYTKADESNFVKPYMKRYVSQSITFDALWHRRITCSLAALEEAQYRHWTYDRFVCVGDSIHKMTPNSGQGGNCAIESAAALANSLYEMTMRHSESHPSIDHIRFALAEYQQSRQFRVKNICDAAYFAMRVETLATLKHWCIAFFVLPRSRDYLIDRHCNAMVGATKLDFLPIPETSLGGTISFDATRGAGQKDSQARRALRALPLLALLFAAPYIARDVFPFTEGLSVSSRLAIDNRSFMRLFDAIKGIDKHLSLGGGPDQTLGSPTIKFMADFTPLQVIWTIESLRRGNFLTFATFPALLGIVSQFTGLEYVAPLYYFLHYVQTPLEKYHALDNRLVPTHYAKTLIPGVMVSYLLPTIAIFHMPLSVDTGRWISVTCLLYPIWTALVHHIFASFVMDTTNHDRIHNPRADMVYLRRAYAFGAIASGVVYRCPWMTSLLSTPDISSHGILSPDPQATVVAAWVRYNHLITFAGGLMWQLLHFIDLKKAQRLNVRLAYIVGVVAGTALLLGPGAAMAVAWSWREEQLSNGRDTAYKLH